MKKKRKFKKPLRLRNIPSSNKILTEKKLLENVYLRLDKLVNKSILRDCIEIIFSAISEDLMLLHQVTIPNFAVFRPSLVTSYTRKKNKPKQITSEKLIIKTEFDSDFKKILQQYKSKFE